MKTAQTANGTSIVASGKAPPQAICPCCQGVVTLRRRQRMNNGGIIYFWRHLSNRNRFCSARRRPVG